MGGYFLQNSPEGDPAFADGVVEEVGAEGVLRAQLDQFPHQQVSFVYAQLVKGRDGRVHSVIAEVMNFRLHVAPGAIVIGDDDAQVSFFHVRFLPFCSSLGTS